MVDRVTVLVTALVTALVALGSTLTGQVTDAATGQPVAEAWVLLYPSPTCSDVYWEVPTDAAGRYYMDVTGYWQCWERYPATNLRFAVRKSGYLRLVRDMPAFTVLPLSSVDWQLTRHSRQAYLPMVQRAAGQ